MVSIRELNNGEDYGDLSSEIPSLIQGVLDEFKDIMPLEHLKISHLDERWIMR